MVLSFLFTFLVINKSIFFLETMRLYPVLPFMQKMCTKTYTLSNGLTVEQGTPIIIPNQGLSHDPKYFANPEEFQPERFLDSQKDNLVKYASMPFGEGPRACIGNNNSYKMVIKKCLSNVL